MFHRPGRISYDGILSVLVENNAAGQGLLQAEQHPAQLVHTAVGESAEAQDLAPVQRHIDILEEGAQGDVSGLQQHLAAVGSVVIGSEIVALKLPADHQGAHPLHGHALPVQGVDNQAVPEDGDRVAPLHQLIQIVTDEQHRPVFLLHPFNEFVNEPASLRRQGGRRLVNDEDIRLADHSPGNLHDLPVLKVELLDVHAAFDLRDADFRQYRVRLPVDPLPVQEAESGKLLQTSGKNIGCHVQPRKGGRLLNNHGNPVILRVHHAVRRVFFPVEEEFSAVHAQSARHNGGKRGFAGAVLADQAANFPAVDLHIHIDQCPRRAKCLAYFPCRKDQFIFHLQTSLPWSGIIAVLRRLSLPFDRFTPLFAG